MTNLFDALLWGFHDAFTPFGLAVWAFVVAASFLLRRASSGRRAFTISFIIFYYWLSLALQHPFFVSLMLWSFMPAWLSFLYLVTGCFLILVSFGLWRTWRLIVSGVAPGTRVTCDTDPLLAVVRIAPGWSIPAGFLMAGIFALIVYSWPPDISLTLLSIQLTVKGKEAGSLQLLMFYQLFKVAALVLTVVVTESVLPLKIVRTELDKGLSLAYSVSAAVMGAAGLGMLVIVFQQQF